MSIMINGTKDFPILDIPDFAWITDHDCTHQIWRCCQASNLQMICIPVSRILIYRLNLWPETKK